MTSASTRLVHTSVNHITASRSAVQGREHKYFKCTTKGRSEGGEESLRHQRSPQRSPGDVSVEVECGDHKELCEVSSEDQT
ncbi:hypothetical protein PDJAM_G00204610 [Pangasius djambal]|uniref:Uncharacterized protein n=1 Tax=Pangasius djambal TaxID=1691987 RepID=A0ACC5Y9Y6_9TELE|nr:hypothetical protein [Pangasius djambal]